MAKLLVTEYGCASCHEINGIKKPDNFAPELTRIGSKPLTQIVFLPGMQHTLPDYVAAKVRQPRSFGSALKMPQFTLTPAQIEALTTALLSLTDRAHDLPLALTVPSQPVSNYQPAGRAGQLMADMACFSCHAINGRGGDMAPDLTWEGSSVQRPVAADFLKESQHPASGADPPHAEVQPFGQRIKELDRLHHDRLSNAGHSIATRCRPAGTPPAQVEQGRQLFYSKYACQSCHIVDTKTDKGYIGPTLTQVGSRLNAAWIYGLAARIRRRCGPAPRNRTAT